MPIIVNLSSIHTLHFKTLPDEAASDIRVVSQYHSDGVEASKLGIPAENVLCADEFFKRSALEMKRTH